MRMVDPWAEPHRVPIVGSRAKASQDGDLKAVVDTSWVTSTKLASSGLTGPWFTGTRQRSRHASCVAE